MIPVSVIVATRNEAANIERCLAALKYFSEVIVVDSHSDDDTRQKAQEAGAQIVNFTWNGQYPKKRQWCLDHLTLKHDWVFFVDADEILTRDLVTEIEQLFKTPPPCAGYFVKGRYVINGRALRFGLHNNKLSLLDRRRMAFPVIDDLDMPGMGEMEGHYQPVFKQGKAGRIGQLKAPLLHYAHNDKWDERHKRYAAWEQAMSRANAWPRDPVRWRQILKTCFRALPGRPFAAFLHCYIFKGGLLDGAAGWRFAASRFRYYRLVTAK